MSPELIVALDVSKLEEAEKIVSLLSPIVKFFKIGSQLFTACGPGAVKMVADKGGKVFLDLKFHDIPNTVYNATASGTSSCIAVYSIPSGLDEEKADDQATKHLSSPVFMMTLHTLGGLEMLKEGVRGAECEAAKQGIKKPILVGVTKLTSEPATPEEVLERAHLAKTAGLDGVVCAVSEVSRIRKEIGEEFIIVTPGIRPKGVKMDDQKRAATAEEAVQAGANYLVVGRPILEAKDPLSTTQEILDSISA